jgi:hypothetical protein
MSDNPIPPIDIKAMWKNQPRAITPLAPEIIRRNARRLQRRRLRVLIQETLGVIVLVVFLGLEIRILPGPVLKIGAGLTVLAALFYVWRLFVLIRPQRVPDGAAACLDFHRRELARQRDLCRGMWRWAILPFVVAGAVVYVGRWTALPSIGRSAGIAHLLIIAGAVVMIESFVLIWLWNLHRADKWQDQLDELDALDKEERA